MLSYKVHVIHDSRVLLLFNLRIHEVNLFKMIYSQYISGVV